MSVANAAAGDGAFDSVTWDTAATTATMVAHAPKTQRWNDSGAGNEGGAGSSMLGPADPQVCDWTFGATRQWAIGAVIIANDGAGAGGATNPGWFSSRGGWW